ncbi:MAG TPA: thrombospondin type 3 repeat-containing protein [Kofleriaceae bacterium]|jgi:hypothetical protein
MKKHAWLAVLLMACGGGGGGQDPDAGLDAVPVDASADAVPDATIQIDANTTDTDGDGVYDEVDVCPTIADPAQLDLDGDHIGWMCDPVESITFPAVGQPLDAKTAVRGMTASASLEYACPTGTCQAAVISVGPGGKSIVDSHATPWVAAIPNWGWVAGENHVLWSRITDGSGDHSAADGSFTPRYDGPLSGSVEFGTKRFERGGLVVLPSESPTHGYALLEPQQDGTVSVVAESAFDYGVTLMTGTDAAPALVFSMSTAGQPGYALKRYTSGQALETLAVGGVALSHAFEIAPVMTSGGAIAGICVDQDNVRYFVRADETGVSSTVFSIPHCNVAGGQTVDRRLQVVEASTDGTHPTSGAAFILDGVVHPLTPLAFNVYGRTVPAVIRSGVDDAERFDAIDAAGTVHAMATGVTDAIVSTEGETLHVIAKRGSDRVLFRYHNGVVSEVALPAAVSSADFLQLFTTVEGAAVIRLAGSTYVVASQATVASQAPFTDFQLLVRDGVNVAAATASTANAKPRVYTYSEVASAPTYTALTAEAMTSVFLDPVDSIDHTTTTKWFAVHQDGECTLERPVVTGGVVSLVGSSPCFAGAFVEGTTPDGKQVIHVSDHGSRDDIYLLDGDTMTKVATGKFQMVVTFAEQDSHVVQAWSGTDLQNANFICQASHPERCWTPPYIGGRLSSRMPGQTDGFHAVYLETLSLMSGKLTSIKTIGNGTRAQPL